MDTPFLLEHHTLGEMPYLIVRPRTPGRYPGIVALHGLTGDKETMLPLAVPLALANFVVACPDARYHGGRRDEVWMQWLEREREVAVLRAVTETAAELPALVDTLLARPDVQPDGTVGVGIVGVSMGGLILQTAVPQEPRFTVAASLISGGVWGARFAEQYAHAPVELQAAMEEHSVDHHLDAFARLALLILAGAEDQVFPAWSARQFSDALRPLVPDPARLRLVIEPGVDHTVTQAMGMETIAWFHTWLSPRPAAR
jgi:dienelactone hydrolase